MSKQPRWRALGSAMKPAGSRSLLGLPSLLGSLSLLGLLSLANACSDEPLTFRGELCRTPGCAPGCESLEVEPCDVEQRSCQKLVFRSVRCVHGGALFEVPVTESKSRDQFSEEVSERVMEPRDPNEVLERAYIDRSLRLLGLLADDRTGDEEAVTVQSSAAAVFSSEDDAVTVVQMGPQWVAMKTLAHEYVHAQQEASYRNGISGLYEQAPRTQAGSQAAQAFIEGEAVLYEWLTFAFMRRTPVEAWGVEAYWELTLRDYQRAAASAPSPWYPSRAWLHYPVGALYLLEAFRRGGHQAVQALRRQIPPHFSYWLQGYPPSSQFQRRRAAGLTCSAPATEDGFKWIAADELGPSAVFAVAAQRLNTSSLAIEPAWELAGALVRDSLAIFAERRAATPAAAQRELLGAPRSLAAALGLGAGSRARGLGDSFAAGGDWHAVASGTGAVVGGLDAGVAAVEMPDSGIADSDTTDSGTTDSGTAGDAGQSGAIDAGLGGVGEGETELLPGGRVRVVWQLQFSDEASAKTFESVVETLGGGESRVLREGRELLLMASDEPLPPSWLQRSCR